LPAKTGGSGLCGHRVRHGSAEALHEAPQRVEPLPLGAEHRAQDHLERNRLHLGVDRERAPDRPALDGPVDDRPHRLAVGQHPLAVEGRHHEAPLALVASAVEREDGARPEERLQGDERLAAT